jgi:hypothetical protein
MTALAGVGGVVIGSLITYLTMRGTHRRERRLDAYFAVMESFPAVARVGATLMSIEFRLGYEEMRRRGSEFAGLWDEWTRALDAFIRDCAKAQTVGSGRARAKVDELRQFVDLTIRSKRPFDPRHEATTAPSAVESRAFELLSEFANTVRSDA